MTEQLDRAAPPVKLCRYRCPLCGKETRKLLQVEDAREHTANALIQHIRMTDDDAHGDKYSVPATGVPDGVSAHVDTQRVAD